MCFSKTQRPRPRFENPIEYQFTRDTTAPLKYAGRQLCKALDALSKTLMEFLKGHCLAGRQRLNVLRNH